MKLKETKRTFFFNSYSATRQLISLMDDIERRGNFESGIMVTVGPVQKKRSLSQNSLFWKWVSEIRDQATDSTGKHFTSEYWHWYFCENLLEKKAIEGPEGNIIAVQQATSKLGVKAFAEFLTKIEAWAVSDCGFELSRPEDLYWESLGVKR